MPANDTIRILQARGAQADPLDAEEWRRVAARAAWVRETMAKLRATQRRVDLAWDHMLAEIPEDLDEEELDALDLPAPPEQSELDAIHAEIRAVIDHDRWPRHLHFSGI